MDHAAAFANGTHASSLLGARWAAERSALEALAEDPLIGPHVGGEAAAGADLARQHFLSDAVRIDPSLLPNLAGAFGTLEARVDLDRPLEAYVYAGHEINGSVLRTGSRFIVTLSSGAVERLTAHELDFVIGHELGHAAYGHLEVPVHRLLQTPGITEAQAMALFAWKRRAEISADRAGLLACGDLQEAANALFKMLSGLSRDDLRIDPRDFASQWDELAGEVARQSGRGHWQCTHPFPAMRMRALVHRAEVLAGDRDEVEADRDLEAMLAMMDPLARRASGLADPILGPFLLWGGLYVIASGAHRAEELERLRELCGRDAVDRAVAEVGADGPPCFERFRAERNARRKPLSALELHTIFTALADLARRDGDIDPAERLALAHLASESGVAATFLERVLAPAA